MRHTRRKVNGTIFRQQVARARMGITSIRESLRHINDGKLGPATQSMYIAKAAVSLSEIQEAVLEIEKLINEQPDEKENADHVS